MGSSRDQLEARISAIREEFRRSLPDRVAQLRVQWRAVVEAGSAPALDALALQVHTLKGAAATFRFDAVAQTADRVMEILAPLRESRRLPDGFERERIEALLAQLQAQAVAAQ